MAEEIKLTQDEAPESRNFIHAFIEEDIGPGGQFEGMTVRDPPPLPAGAQRLPAHRALQGADHRLRHGGEVRRPVQPADG